MMPMQNLTRISIRPKLQVLINNQVSFSSGCGA
jgi:hypothetical protein